MEIKRLLTDGRAVAWEGKGLYYLDYDWDMWRKVARGAHAPLEAPTTIITQPQVTDPPADQAHRPWR